MTLQPRMKLRVTAESGAVLTLRLVQTHSSILRSAEFVVEGCCPEPHFYRIRPSRRIPCFSKLHVPGAPSVLAETERLAKSG